VERARGKRLTGVTWRAVIIGLVLIPPVTFWIMEVECVWHSGHPTSISLMWGVVFVMFLVILINLLVRKLLPNAALTQGELITIYVMLCMAAALAGHDSLQLTIPAIPHAFWFATPENEWVEMVQPYVPRWLVVSDKNLMRGFYEGETPFYTREIMGAWTGLTLWWTGFIVALCLIMICLNVIVRKQWTEHEKLAYPIIQLPLAITEGGGTSRFFKDRMLWMGFGVAAMIDIINGLSYFYPQMPRIPVRHDYYDLGQYFTEKPWNAMGSIPVPFYPFVVGLGFLLPLDLSFSLWFFYLFRKAQEVATSAMGVRLPRFPYLSEQSAGAWFGLFFIAVWVTRSHLKEVFKKVFGLKTPLDDSEEPISYRLAVILIAASSGFIIWFCLRAGMTVGVVIAFFAIFYAFSLAITRSRAELGPPAHEMAGMMNSQQILVNVLGSRRMGVSNLTVSMYFWFFTGRGYRNHIMPHQLEGFKMAERARMSNKRLVLAMTLAIIFGSIASFWSLVSELYRLGGETGPSVGHIGQFGWLTNQLNYPRGTDYPAIIGMLVGLIFTFFLMVMRMRFLWWPFHPAGYALSTNFGVEYFWTCLVIATIVKWVVLKFGGASAYRKGVSFFFGVILGEYCVGAFWSAISVIFQTYTYDFAPG
jgi:hypothetical protein